MEPRIELLKRKKMVGQRFIMSLSNDKTFQLWNTFMPRRKEILNKVGADLFSIQIYDRSLIFDNFNDTTEFEKWAAVEVSNYDSIPSGMEKIELTEGLYAVFQYVGPASAADQIFHHIFTVWFPKSGFVLDNTRAHLAVMTEGYNPNDPNAEEELWIPVKN